VRGELAIEFWEHTGAGSALLEFGIEEVRVELEGRIPRLFAISTEQLDHGGELGHTAHIAGCLPKIVGVDDRHFLSEDEK
jgi:hypothetical protein